MSRCATTLWTQQVQRRLAAGSTASGETPATVESVVRAVAQRLHVDPVVLLGALAVDPPPATLWAEIQRVLGREQAYRTSDWQEMHAAASALSLAHGRRPTISCWVVEPSSPLDVFVAASCLAAAFTPRLVTIVATHSDPVLLELGRGGLVPDAALRDAPPRQREEHFRHIGQCWQLMPALRTAIRFEVARPLPHASPGFANAYDLVVWRGARAHLQARTAQRFSRRIFRALRTGGFLLVGPDEHDVPWLDAFERCVAPSVLLYRKPRLSRRPEPPTTGLDFAALLAAIERDPTACEPRIRLACELLRQGFAEPAIMHLRAVVRRSPDFAAAWRALAQAHTLLGDTTAALAADTRAAVVAAAEPLAGARANGTHC